MGQNYSCFETGHWDVHPQINNDYPEPGAEVDQDMTQPLPHYFISSGHNSYLSGNQLFGVAGTDTIIKALTAGCRVIELDVYDSSNGPVCTHGGTMTWSVPFKDCVLAIREHAFKTSPYPVILTMENHTEQAGQGKMAAILREALGDMLFVPERADRMGQYRSPEDLRHKVVCRTSISAKLGSGATHEDFKALIYIRNAKFDSLGEMIKRDKVVSSSFAETKLPKVAELTALGGGAEEERDAAQDEKDEAAVHKREARVRRQATLRGQGTLSPRRQHHNPVEGGAAGAQGHGHGHGGRAGSVANLGGYLAPDTEPADRVEQIVTGSAHEMYLYSAKHLMRVYPAGWRITSGNYNPMAAWARGASFAALNWQSWGPPLWCNEAMFSGNGRCGYLLKPPWMRNPASALPSSAPRRLRVHVYGAHKHQGSRWCFWKDDIFVRLDVWGMPGDRKSQHTKTALNSGRLVVGRDFLFDVRFPEMAVLGLTLLDEDPGDCVCHQMDADKLAYRAIPLASLRPGTYKLAMRDADSGRPLDAGRVWVKVELEWVASTGGSSGREGAAEGGERAAASRAPEAAGNGAAANPVYGGPQAAGA